MSFKKIVEAGAATILFLTPVKSSINSVVAAEGSKSQSVACQGFFDVANIRYTPALWVEQRHRIESGFIQLSQPGQVGYVEEVDFGNPPNGIVTFPIGANVTGYVDVTTKKVISLPDGTTLDSYKTCYTSIVTRKP